MNELKLKCPDCGTIFPDSPPYRKISRMNHSDTTRCPNPDCDLSRKDSHSRFFQKYLIKQSPGVGTPLGKTYSDKTPAQLALDNLWSAASKLDEMGLFQSADQVEKMIKKYY